MGFDSVRKKGQWYRIKLKTNTTRWWVHEPLNKRETKASNSVECVHVDVCMLGILHPSGLICTSTHAWSFTTPWQSILYRRMFHLRLTGKGCICKQT